MSMVKKCLFSLAAVAVMTVSTGTLVGCGDDITIVNPVDTPDTTGSGIDTDTDTDTTGNGNDTTGNGTDTTGNGNGIPANILVFDDFEKDTTIDKFTNQTVLGRALGATKDSVKWGGSFWYAGASGYGAKILGFTEDGTTFEVVSADGTESLKGDAGNVLMSSLLGDGSMTFDLNCTAEVEESWWAFVGVAIVGDAHHIEDTDGVTKRSVENGVIIDDILTVDLSALESISVKGTIQGSAKLALTGARGTGGIDSSGMIYVVIESVTSDAYVDFDTTIAMDKFVKNVDWMGGEWDEIKDAVSNLVFELNTASREMGTQAIIKLEDIKFNFTNGEAKETAFPFVK